MTEVEEAVGRLTAYRDVIAANKGAGFKPEGPFVADLSTVLTALSEMQADISGKGGRVVSEEDGWRVWRDGEWTILHISTGGAQTTTSLTDAAAWRLVGALTPTSKPEPNPEWEAKANAAQQRIRDELREGGDDYPANLSDALRMLEKWIPHAEPANEHGQISFSRALMESAAESMRAALATLPPAPAEVAGLIAEGRREAAFLNDGSPVSNYYGSLLSRLATALEQATTAGVG